ncbi:hypothetical protein L211DRAFT_378063 [Terfezia boudieri ATCC MYA-4762]|uniref:Uncharacterized protein n=1 Tax=Terfezia boudieri ATCC MYA-4762 TaxID=1051890 RepID=A0A3N4LZU0_9PEZI|nr:hypothetical protein L211DRAFT_378063 [Terfezia boudieri ATCC MYA-4762]
MGSPQICLHHFTVSPLQGNFPVLGRSLMSPHQTIVPKAIPSLAAEKRNPSIPSLIHTSPSPYLHTHHHHRPGQRFPSNPTMTTANLYHSKGRPCGASYLVTSREAGVMAKKGSKRLRGEKKWATKLQHSGQLSSPLVSSIPQRILPFTSDSPLDIIYIRRPSHRRSSFGAPRRTRARKLCIRTRARRTYLRHFERRLSPKPHCEGQQQQPTLQLPANVMPNDLDPRGIGNKAVYRHLDLIDIIDKVEVEEKDRDRLHGLVTCAEEFKMSQNKKYYNPWYDACFTYI